MMSTLAHIGIDTKWEMLTFIIFIMVLIFLLGFPFEWIEICLIVLPVFAPILAKYDFSDHLGNNTALMTWFGTGVTGSSIVLDDLARRPRSLDCAGWRKSLGSPRL